MSTDEAIASFLQGSPHAVVGASLDRAKYGNKVLRAYLQSGRQVYPIHPRETSVEGVCAFPDLAAVPAPLYGVSVVTPPAVAESIIQQAAQLGIQHVWFQPGAESQPAVTLARGLGMNVIAGGPCILVTLRYREP